MLKAPSQSVQDMHERLKQHRAPITTDLHEPEGSRREMKTLRGIREPSTARIQGTQIFPNVIFYAVKQNKCFNELKKNDQVNNVMNTLVRRIRCYNGFWESWKLQLKLMSQTLAGIEWDEHIGPEDQESWKQQLS